MNFGVTTYGLAGLAGALSTLSPCVLPLVPVLFASAVSAHRWGAVVLGLGLALSFTLIGTLLATTGAALGIEPDTFRTVGGVILGLFGLVLLMPALQSAFARAASVVSNSGNQLLARVTFDGLPGQFLIGLLLGVVWSPCVGPTLGAATTLASQGRDLGQISLLMLVFGIGAAAPLVLLGSLSRASLGKIRTRLLSVGSVGKQGLGVVMLLLGLLISTGLDKPVEAWLLDRTPNWLTALAIRF
jgi:cytochrome c biogenesis protein CcdA